MSSILSRTLQRTFEAINRGREWHRLPTPLAILNLIALRHRLREKNLHDTWTPGSLRRSDPSTVAPQQCGFRTPDGGFNSLEHPEMGQAGTRFGRNVPLEETFPEPAPKLLDPNPRLISRRLMTRERFVPAPTLNLLAAAWIQFMVHDWFSHGDNSRESYFDLDLEEDDGWFERPMRIAHTAADPTRCAEDEGRPPTYVNRCTHWWDASSIYGSDLETMRALRSHLDGKLRLEAGRLPLDPATRTVSTGFNDNWWIGLGLLHTLFVLEHNTICERLKREYPGWSDERLFQTARLINVALMAKIHMVEWTPGILGHPALQIGMRVAWWGLIGERLHALAGRIGTGEVLSGLPGSTLNHHGVPFSLTEEFVSVYRLHPLIPDEIEFRSRSTGELLERRTFPEVAFERAQTIIGERISVTDVLYSFGIAHPGAITLHNFPRFLQDLTRPDGTRLDLAAVDILRDRERGVPRYNRFRELFHLPPVRSFEELTPNRAWAEEIRELYGGDLDRVDLLVGLLAENPPAGFGFGDTAFRVFILMASRRLQSDRFFTTDYTPRVYTQTGLDWIQENTMKSVLLRHYPELEAALRGVQNAFAPWNPVAARAAQQAQPMEAAAPARLVAS